jgi:HAD superfamily hydrolase (TIGR01509 family)
VNTLIRAIIFDLDGTLVQTEKLKAVSYAQAVAELFPGPVSEIDIIEAYKRVVGRSRAEVARYLVDNFRLEFKSKREVVEFRGLEDWQILIRVRLKKYASMLSEPEILLKHRWPYNLEVLEAARARRCKTGLATMSSAVQTNEVLKALGMQDEFDFIGTRDDVENGKPDPEIYNLVICELEVHPRQALVLEDSPAGISAAQAAGAHVIAVTTPFTRDRVHEMGLDPRRVVDEAELVPGVVNELLAELQSEG